MRSGNEPNVELEFYFQPGDDNPDMGSYSFNIKDVVGHFNLESVSRTYRVGDVRDENYYRPIAAGRPIVLAINGGQEGCYFVVLDSHLNGGKAGWTRFKPHRTQQTSGPYHVECSIGGQLPYWKIRVGEVTYGYSRNTLPGCERVSLENICEKLAELYQVPTPAVTY